MISLGVQTELDFLFEDMPSKKNAKFFEYHEKHPEVYETFKKLALQSMEMGHETFSARGLFQVMRWKMGGAVKDDGFKYNNNHTPYYVRLFEKDFPQHIGFFEKRKVKQELN